MSLDLDSILNSLADARGACYRKELNDPKPSGTRLSLTNADRAHAGPPRPCGSRRRAARGGDHPARTAWRAVRVGRRARTRAREHDDPPPWAPGSAPARPGHRCGRAGCRGRARGTSGRPMIATVDRNDVARRIFAMGGLSLTARARMLGVGRGTLDKIVCWLSASEATYRQLLPRLEALEAAYREVLPSDAVLESDLDAYREQREAVAARRVSAKDLFVARVCARLPARRGLK